MGGGEAENGRRKTYRANEERFHISIIIAKVRILTRYIFKEISSHAVLGLGMFTFVLFTRDVGHLLDLLVRSTTTPGMVGKLFLMLLPSVLTVTIPMSVLVGTLIGLSRMSSDSEVTAARASGLSIYSFVRPVMMLAFLGCAAGLTCAAWLSPVSTRALVRVENAMRANQVSAEVQPRVFEERFPNMVLYVNDAPSSTASEWRGVFLAEVPPKPADSASTAPPPQGGLSSNGPKITVAERAETLPDTVHNNLQLHLIAGSTHQVTPEAPGNYKVSNFEESDIVVDLPAPEVSKARPFTEQYMRELWSVPPIDDDGRLARIEFHRRIAIPMGALVLAIVAIPLGVSSRKGGKSMGVVLTLLLVCGYYLLLVFGVSLARRGVVPAGAGVWMPNAVFLTAGITALLRAERIRRGHSIGASLSAWLKTWEQRFVRMELGSTGIGRLGAGFPQLLDSYVLRGFLFYFGIVLAGFLMLIEIITFFGLIEDIIRFKQSWAVVGKYFFFLAPELLYQTAPLAVLVAALISFALLTKDNEIVAMKACGVSLYRISVPVFLAAVVIAGGLFAADHFYLPDANIKQDGLRNQIKGRAPQTYLNPSRTWILGQHSRIYHYNYFDNVHNVMAGVQIFELDPKTFQIKRRIGADRAHWGGRLNAWVLEDGWVRDFKGLDVVHEPFVVKSFPELEERPSYFKKEVITSQQMNYIQLRTYIADLEQSGFDVVPLLVQLHKKFAFPLYAPIMALIAIPFAFTVGRKGALAGIASSMAIAMVYWIVTVFFEKIGGIDVLPPSLAAWAPAALFGMSGLYLLLKVRT